MLRIGALLDPEIGARAEAALSAISHAMWRDDKHLRVRRRTPAQRDADALAYLLCGVTLSEADAKAIAKLIGQTSGKTPPPEQPGATGSADTARPAVQVMIEYEALRGRTDAAGITDAGTELAPEIERNPDGTWTTGPQPRAP